MSFSPEGHHWSGWPGAQCLKCGAEDPMEIALGENMFDPETDEWRDDEARKKYVAASICPVKGCLVWNHETHKWELKKEK